MRNCSKCGKAIAPERLEFLPGTKHCVNCSQEKKNLALSVQEHKTGAYTVVIETNGPGGSERVRQAVRAFRRGR